MKHPRHYSLTRALHEGPRPDRQCAEAHFHEPRSRRLGGPAWLWWLVLLPTACITWLAHANDAEEVPAQRPLFSIVEAMPAPNVMLTLDDSTSMASGLVPTGDIPVAAAAGRVWQAGTALPEDYAHHYRLHPADAAIGVVIAANPYSTNPRQMMVRSPDVNSLYYSPDQRYVPWTTGEGTLMPPASPQAAALNPTDTSAGFADLTTNDDNHSGSAWCHMLQMASDNPTCAYVEPDTKKTWCSNWAGPGGSVNVNWVAQKDRCFRKTNLERSSLALRADAPAHVGTSGVPFYPGLYYRLKKGEDGHFLDPSVADHYESFDVNSPTRFAAAGFKHAARVDCMATRCTQAEELQNFANWFTYYRSRLRLAQGVTGQALAELDRPVRIGLARINRNRIISHGVTPLNDDWRRRLVGLVYTDWKADGRYGTPLRHALDAVGQYFRWAEPGGPWDNDDPSTGQTSCRRNANLMVTDGVWNFDLGNSMPFGTQSIGDVDSDGRPDMLADFALQHWGQDLRPDLPNTLVASNENPATWQHMVNLLVGLGLRGDIDRNTTSPIYSGPFADSTRGLLHGGSSALSSGPWSSNRIDDLWHAAVNSRGLYFSSSTAGMLSQQIQLALYNVTRGQDLRATAVAVASTVAVEPNRVYSAGYDPAYWSGDIRAHELRLDGSAGGLAWSAEARLPHARHRQIVTWNGRTSAPFTWNGLAPIGGPNLRPRLQLPLGVSGPELVNYLRGDRSLEGRERPLRTRAPRQDAAADRPVLGDFVNSRPLFVRDQLDMGYQTLPSVQGGHLYSAFLRAKSARAGLLVASANNGMVHALRDTLGQQSTRDGEEVVAYIPGAVLPHLHVLADKQYASPQLPHRFLVDGPLSESDAYLDGRWRNLVLGSLGAGGRAVFALDVTDLGSADEAAALHNARNPVRWELTHEDLGHVSTAIETGVLPDGTWVAVFGNGPNSARGQATLFVVRLSDGMVQTVPVGEPGSNALGGVGVVRNGLGQIISLYAGDFKGMLWRFDVADSVLAKAGRAFEAPGSGVGKGDASDKALSAMPAAPYFASVYPQGLLRTQSPEASLALDAVVNGGRAQPIMQAPRVMEHPLGGRLVVVGTGKLITESDAVSSQRQSVYAVRDQASGPSGGFPVERGRLALRTLRLQEGSGSEARSYMLVGGEAVNWVTQVGWVMDFLPGVEGLPSERVVLPISVVSPTEIRVDSSQPPTGKDPCGALQATGASYRLKVLTGLPGYPIFDTDGSGQVNESDAMAAGYRVRHGSGTVQLRPAPGTGVGDDPAGSANPCGAGAIALIDVNQGEQTISCVRSGSARQVVDRLWRRIALPPWS